jgi:hypothetical protein
LQVGTGAPPGVLDTLSPPEPGESQLPAILTAPLLDVALSDLFALDDASPTHAPTGTVAEIVECKCILAAFGQLPAPTA